MKKLAIIPSRYESSRFPGKPLIDLNGKSMIKRVYDGVEGAALFDKTVVATDDQRIFDHVESFGGEAIMTSKNHESGTDRCGEVINVFSDYDVVVNIQGDEPLVDKKQLDQLISAFDDESVEIATLGTPKITEAEYKDNNRIKIVVNHKKNALYFSRSAIPFERNENEYPFLRHIGLYGFKTSTLSKLVDLRPTKLEKTESLEQLRWLYYGFNIRVIETLIETPNIDVPEDVEAVVRMLKD
ncbi:MAG: 3-deoxy-manno-octulosonate cytidylyltransferase [Fluviicola sp.]|nr:MAG: 3-deoxy-manno-octulosonate cytidylyltransferase [Fluviicola sp.]